MGKQKGDKNHADDFKQAADTERITVVHSQTLQSSFKWLFFFFDYAFLSPLPLVCAASVELPWQRAVSQNKVPYYIK